MCRDGNDPIAKPPGNDLRVVREALSSLAREPAPVTALQFCRQIPVIKRRVRLNVAREQPIAQPLVEGETCLVHCAAAGRLDPWPRDREAVGANAEICDQVQVRFEPVIVIARDIGITAVGDRAGHAAEFVPDRGSLAVRTRRAFDLERAGCYAPDEVPWKALSQPGW
jgi:hypothetical protein